MLRVRALLAVGHMPRGYVGALHVVRLQRCVASYPVAPLATVGYCEYWRVLGTVLCVARRPVATLRCTIPESEKPKMPTHWLFVTAF